MISVLSHRWQPLLVAGLGGLILIGCDSSNVDTDFGGRCTDAFGPAGPVNATLQSFDVGAGEDEGNLQVNRTLFHLYFQAIQPMGNDEDSHENNGRTHLSDEDAQDLTDLVGDLSTDFVSFEGDYFDYNSTRNLYDLVESLDTGGIINAFSEGRNAMRNCVEEDETADFNINDVRLTERLPEDADDDEEADQFNFRVNFAHRPFPGGNRDNAEIEREVRTPGFSQQVRYFYDPSSYSTTGFNTPKRIIADLLDEDETSNLVFVSERGNEKTDIWLWSLTDDEDSEEPEPRTIDLAGEEREYRCLFVRIQYDPREVDGLLTEEVCSVTTVIGDGGELDGFEFVYSSQDDVPQSPQ